MSKQDIIDRILADAQANAESIIEQANKKAATILAAAEAYSKKETETAQRECNEYANDVMEKRKAAARLEGSKIALAEKRRTLDYVYSVALSKLKEFANQDPLVFYSVLIERYADMGDTVCLPVGFAYPTAVEALPAFEAKGLKLSPERQSRLRYKLKLLPSFHSIPAPTIFAKLHRLSTVTPKQNHGAIHFP